MDVRGRWPDPDRRVSGRLHQRVWVDVPGQWIQDFQFLNPKKKRKKINKSMLIHVHSEISNMFILKGKSHFSGAVSFWRNLQSQRDRNILPKKKRSNTNSYLGKEVRHRGTISFPHHFWISSLLHRQKMNQF